MLAPKVVIVPPGSGLPMTRYLRPGPCITVWAGEVHTTHLDIGIQTK
jgi:hypothetical protein